MHETCVLVFVCYPVDGRYQGQQQWQWKPPFVKDQTLC